MLRDVQRNPNMKERVPVGLRFQEGNMAGQTFSLLDVKLLLGKVEAQQLSGELQLGNGRQR